MVVISFSLFSEAVKGWLSIRSDALPWHAKLNHIDVFKPIKAQWVTIPCQVLSKGEKRDLSSICSVYVLLIEFIVSTN